MFNRLGESCAPERGAIFNGFLQLDFAVGLDLLASLENVLHHGLGICAVCKIHDHLLRHEIDGSLCNALGLVGSFLHEVGTVGTVDFDCIGLFHDGNSFSVCFQ